MSEAIFELNAASRQETGRGASRRLRRCEDKIPAIIYGGKKDATSLVLNHNEVLKALKHEAFYSHILTIKVDGKAEQAVLKDIQRHPFKPKVTHMDFQRVTATEKLHMHVPLHFIGEENAPAVKEGGVFSHMIKDVEVACLPKDLPEYIEVDVSALELDQVIHLSDIKVPKGVELTTLGADNENDQPVVSAHIPKVEVIEEEVTEEAAEGEEGAEAEASAEGETEAKAEGNADAESQEGEAKE